MKIQYLFQLQFKEKINENDDAVVMRSFPRFGEEIGGGQITNFSFSKLISMANVFVASFIFMAPFVRSVFKLVSLSVFTGKSQRHYDWNVKNLKNAP